MRQVFVGIFTLLATLYALGALYLYTEERRARTSREGGDHSPLPGLHPESNLIAVRSAMDQNDFSPAVVLLVHRSFRQLPSFYQPPFLLAAYHANRLEKPEQTHRAFEAALRRYPANGRLHLAYAGWLLGARSIPPAESEVDIGLWTEKLEPELQAERHLATALNLEPQLTRQGLEILRRHRVPAERWAELLPDEASARRQLLPALASAGRRKQALAMLRGMLEEEVDPRYLRQAAKWALQWGDPNLLLEAAHRWQSAERSQGAGSRYHEAAFYMAKAYLELGDADKAFQVFRQALNDVGPSSTAGVELLCSMGNEYLHRRQVVLAQSLFMEAVSLSPDCTPALLGLARTYRQTGNRGKAIDHYQKALQIDPEDTAAERELGQLLLQR
jgi:tetratricopeptide (TPR) repeat protein